MGNRDAARRDAENRRARAEASTVIAEERMARADRDVAALGERERALAEERDALRAEIAATSAAEAGARGALAEVQTADAADRERLATAERETAAARERLRSADTNLRSADHAELEARLGLDALHEAIVVELAGLGEFGIAGLEGEAGVRPGSARIAAALGTQAVESRVVGGMTSEDDEVVSDEAAALEAALALVTPIWAAEPPASPAPSPARLGQLRRQFHELGAVNPYAVDEYAALKERLETLETQASDLRTAIVRTRDLIVELDTMIADRFRTTFEALEAAFSTRFEQLFGGGFAKLSLTDPSDLGSTGIEIVARPPRQEGTGPRDAVGRRAGPDRGRAAVRDARGPTGPVLRPRRGRRGPRRGEHRRFAVPLRGLSHGTQFIVVTHNRGTIEAARRPARRDRQRRSVSRVISLRLDEAQALGAESGPNGAGGVVSTPCPSGADPLRIPDRRGPTDPRGRRAGDPVSSTRRGSRTPPTSTTSRRSPRILLRWINPLLPIKAPATVVTIGLPTTVPPPVNPVRLGRSSCTWRILPCTAGPAMDTSPEHGSGLGTGLEQGRGGRVAAPRASRRFRRRADPVVGRRPETLIAGDVELPFAIELVEHAD